VLKLQRFIFGLCLCCLCPVLSAQHIVEGKVFDLGNFQPVRLCNVFVVGTTMGAATDSTGYYRFEIDRPGKYELVFSHIAYKPELIDIEISDDTLLIDPMPLNVNTRFVEEVVVTGKKDRKWQRMYDRFINYAMGKHFREKKVEIMNPYVVDFKATGRDMITESQPFTLSIRNDYTGYEINFLVQRVFLSKSNQFMVGYPGFTPLETTNPKQQDDWSKNRQKAFNGSIRHVFKSILDNQLTAQGFDLELTENQAKKFQGPAAKILPLNINNDIHLTEENLSEHVRILDTQEPNIKKLVFEKFLKVKYLNEIDNYGNPQLTLIKALEGEVLVYTNGIPVNPTALKLFGYLSGEGLYEMLPFGYDLSK